MATSTGRLRSVSERIEGRVFPSVFQAWAPATNQDAEPMEVTLARHDLIFNIPEFFGLEWQVGGDGRSRPELVSEATCEGILAAYLQRIRRHMTRHSGLATRFTAESVRDALRTRHRLLDLNPGLLLLAEIRYRDVWKEFLPDGHEWWKRKDGQPVMAESALGLRQLDYGHPGFRRQVAAQCRAACESGIFDGIMLDWWGDDPDRTALIEAIRGAIGDDPLVLVNANDRKTPQTARHINGYFMECWRSETADDWRRIQETLEWAEQSLREPRINCVETWRRRSRQELNLMRAVTTMTMVCSDGYCLFAEPEETAIQNHCHDFYPFWAGKVGRPVGRKTVRRDGALSREYEGGTAVYNPIWNAPLVIEFEAPRRSQATGRWARTHPLASLDGDLFLRAPGP